MAGLWGKRKTDWKFYVDVLLFLSVVGLALIGLLLGFVLPKGSAAPDQSKYFLGLHRHAWGDIHLYLGLAFIVLGILHVVLGWSWFKGKARALFPRQWRAALAATPVAALLLVVAFWGVWVQGPQEYAEHDTSSPGDGTDEHGHRVASSGGVTITGQMSLREVEKATGVPARHITRKLGLPADLSLDEPLRQLVHAHGLSVEDVRDVVAAAARQDR